MRHLVLLGLPGSGKTTVGRRVAAATSRPFLDSDELIQAEQGLTGRELAARDGVEALHRHESAVLRAALSSPAPAVIAAAAAVADDADALGAIDSVDAEVVLLVADPVVLAARQDEPGHRRPLSRSDLELLAARREAHYRRLADLVIDTGRTTPEQAVALVLELIGQA